MLDLLQQSKRRRPTADARSLVPSLEPGDHLDQPAFHARYREMPEDVKAELIGGVEEQPPDADGVIRSEVFPGLWLDPAALVGLNGRRLLEVLRHGLATSEHAAFAAQLAARRPGDSPPR